MKYLFLLLMMPCWCMAQKSWWDDSLKVWHFEDYIYIFDSSTKTLVPIPDTVKVIMLVCDTMSKTGFKVYGKPTVYFADKDMFWQYGYKVTNYTGSPYYLNDSKERLSEGIIVWMDKPVTTYTATYDSLGNVYFKEK